MAERLPQLQLSSRGLPESYVGDYSGGVRKNIPELKLSSRGLPESYVGDVRKDNALSKISKIILPKIETTRESYSPQLGMYLSQSPTGYGATAYQRTPTITEAERIRVAQAKGDIFDKSTSEIIKEASVERENIKRFEKLSKGIDELEGEELDKRLLELGGIEGVKITAQSTPEGQEQSIVFEPKTVGIGLGVNKKQVLISRFDTGGAISLYGSALGYGIERGVIKLGYPEEGKSKEVVTPEGTRTQYGGTGIYNPLTGDFESQKLLTLEKTDVVQTAPSARQVGDIAATGRYFIPYAGVTLFAGEVGEKAARGSLSKTEVITLGALTTGFAVVKGAKYLGKNIATREALIVDSKIASPIGTVSKATERSIYFDPITGKQVTKDIGSTFKLFAQTGKEGSKVVVTTRFRKMFGLKPKYSGVPYGNKESYKKVLESLVSEGYSESKARELIRLKRPQLSKQSVKGKLVALTTEDSTTILLAGTKKVKGLAGEKGGVKFLEKKPKESLIESVAKPEGAVGDIEMVEFEERVTNLWKPEGRQIELFSGKAGSKSIKEYSQAELFRQVDVSRRINPLQRRLDTGRAKVLVEKGEPEIIITDLSVGESKGFMGGGKKSSDQFLEQMYKTEGAKAGAVLNLVKPIKVAPLKSAKEVSGALEAPKRIESAWAGTGLYERTIGETVYNIGTNKQTISPTYLKGFIADSKLDLKTDVKQATALDYGLKERLKLKEVAILGVGVKQSLKVEVALITKTSTKTDTPRIKPPTTKVSKIKLPKFSTSKEEDKDKLLEDEFFKVFVKKKGEDIDIGSFKSLGEAKSKLRGELTSTLRASGFVTKGSSKIDVGNFGRGFTTAKKDSLRIVQKRGERLGRRSEVFQIQKAKKGRLFK